MDSFTPLWSYMHISSHVKQGKELLQIIKNYENKHGSAPSPGWFYALDRHQTTLEGRQWIYFEKPVNTRYRSGLRIIVPVDYGRNYLGGFQDGVVVSTTPPYSQKSESH